MVVEACALATEVGEKGAVLSGSVTLVEENNNILADEKSSVTLSEKLRHQTSFSKLKLAALHPTRDSGVVAGSKYAVCQYKVARDRLPSAIAITPGPGHRLSALRQMNIRGMRDLNRGMLSTGMLSGSVSGGVPIATGPGAGAGLSMWDLRDHLEGSSGVKLMTLTLDGAREHLCPLFVPSLRSFDLK
ncbi:hypothetical protein F5879DRAFT_993711 [Lentinula edodes]|nr:hypothetical protein F5879DRAFT_993711 [Lentinula edodes]